MYLTIKQQPKLSKANYDILLELSRYAKNLFNEALYSCRQYYFNEGKYLRYEENYHLLKSSENYRMLNSNMAEQILKDVDGSFKAFFMLLAKAKKGSYLYKDIKLPHYLRKEGYYPLTIGFVRVSNNILVLPMSNSYRKEHSKVEITIPPMLVGKKIKEIRIIPKSDGRFFEIQYTYEAGQDIKEELDFNKSLSIDVGVNNFVTSITNEGKSFILDGRRLKSINQWFNKNNARLLSIKDKQKIAFKTKQQALLERKRNNSINDYISKCARHIINYSLDHNIGNIVIGYNPKLQNETNLGKRNNQTFVNIPFTDKIKF